MIRPSRYVVLLVVPVIAFFVSGCATARLDLPEAMKDSVRYESGCPVLISEKTNAVLLSFSTIPFNRQQNAAVFIQVKNNSSEPFNISPRNVGATLDGKTLKVYTYEELKKKIETDAAWQAFAVALNGMSASIRAAQPRTSSTFGTTSYGTYSGFSTTFEPAATAQAQAVIDANTNQQITAIEAGRNAKLSGLQSLLRLTTVQPDQVKGGVVQIEPPVASSKPKTLRITVSTPADEHAFDLVYKSH